MSPAGPMDKSNNDKRIATGARSDPARYVIGNRMFGTLSLQAREQMLAGCSFHQLPRGTPLYRPEEPVRYVYFLTSGVASVVLPTAEGESAELLLIGPEGLTGGTQLLGPACLQVSCLVQLAGTGYRMRYDLLEELFHSSEEIRSRLLEYIQQGSLAVSQIAGCNRLHPAEGRLARWLLTAQDRTGSAELRFTQEFLAEMLGVQRTTVNSVARTLQATNLIHYCRGRITILDRHGLEAVSCSCFPVLHQLWKNLYTVPFRSRIKLCSRTSTC